MNYYSALVQTSLVMLMPDLSSSQHLEERCEITRDCVEHKSLIAKKVKYEYNSKVYTRHTRQDSGESRRIRVNQSPSWNSLLCSKALVLIISHPGIEVL